jgi:hypothetical protein
LTELPVTLEEKLPTDSPPLVVLVALLLLVITVKMMPPNAKPVWPVINYPVTFVLLLLINIRLASPPTVALKMIVLLAVPIITELDLQMMEQLPLLSSLLLNLSNALAKKEPENPSPPTPSNSP